MTQAGVEETVRQNAMKVLADTVSHMVVGLSDQVSIFILTNK